MAKVDHRRCEHEFHAPRRGSKVLICVWCGDWKHNPKTAGPVITAVETAS